MIPQWVEGGAKSDPQSPLMFTPSNGNSPVMQENRGVDYEKLGREVDDQIKKLESMGGPGVSQPFMSATGGGETLAGDTYQRNKVEGDPANDLKRKQKKNTLFDDYIFNRDVLQPTPPSYAGGEGECWWSQEEGSQHSRLFDST